MNTETTVGIDSNGDLYIACDGMSWYCVDEEDFHETLLDMFKTEDTYELLDIIDEALANGQSIESLLSKSKNQNEMSTIKNFRTKNHNTNDGRVIPLFELENDHLVTIINMKINYAIAAAEYFDSKGAVAKTSTYDDLYGGSTADKEAMLKSRRTWAYDRIEEYVTEGLLRGVITDDMTEGLRKMYAYNEVPANSISLIALPDVFEEL